MEISEIPAPGKFYSIQKSKGGFLTTVSKAYGLSSGAERLALAKRINDHPLNRKFWVTPTSSFNRKHFPNGIISFQPLFTCDDIQRRANKGEKKCFARLWIPRIGSDPKLMYISSPPISSTTSSIDTLKIIATVCNTNIVTHGIIGDDNRKPVKNRLTVPYRWVCQLVLLYNPTATAKNMAIGRATGFLFGNTNRLVTSAHVLHDPNSDLRAQGYDIVPDSILVLPALKGVTETASALKKNDLPFGALMVSRLNKKSVANFRVAPEWKLAQSSLFDYGTIDLGSAKSISPGKSTDAWGTISRQLATFAAERRDAVKVGQLILSHRGRSKGLFLTGYPADKPCSQMQVAHGSIIKLENPIDSSHNVLLHHADTVEGSSGSPVWVERKRVNKTTKSQITQRILIGIAAAVHPLVSPGKEQLTTPPTLVNAITIITPRVLRRLKKPATKLANA